VQLAQVGLGAELQRRAHAVELQEDDLVRTGAQQRPRDYLLTIRLNRAKDLLAATDLPVASVARRVGYEDPAYFTRLFTRRAGLPPREFRTQQFRGVPAGP
jgi:transcriptional regulator GlxA family with amidase domain